jgi:hypothetical protein
MTKQEEMHPRLSEKIYNEFLKGFMNFLLYGREGYYIAPDGEIRAIDDNELERVIHEGEIQEVRFESLDSYKSTSD